MVYPAHPAYAKPTLPSTAARSQFSNEVVFPGDVKKAVAKMYELTETENPPVRLALGKDAVGAIKAKLASLGANVENYESWSADLLLNSADETPFINL